MSPSPAAPSSSSSSSASVGCGLDAAQFLRERLLVVDLRGERAHLRVRLGDKIRHQLFVGDRRRHADALGLAGGLPEQRADRLCGRNRRVHREVARTGGRGLHVRAVLVDVDRQVFRLEHDAVGDDGTEVESDLLRLDPEFTQHTREVGAHLVARLGDDGVRQHLDRPLLNPGFRAGLLEFADERTGVDPRVTLRDDDLVGGDLAGTDWCRGLRRLQLLVEPERVVVRPDESNVTGHLLAEIGDGAAGRLQRANGERVAAHPQCRLPVQLPAHVLELSGGDSGKVDDADGVVAVDEVGEFLDLLTLPLGNVRGLVSGGVAHAGTSTAGPIVVFT